MKSAWTAIDESDFPLQLIVGVYVGSLGANATRNFAHTRTTE